ncbi:hypothetical protein [Anaeromicrobium sediminis]|uniref:Uncharacterized protein n=1 Tax=Anaeromicrobium sediminis TaxID=1478221 RepID=A0A267MK60_9FIRM|nr:hypothetical protein [Anaeromicrobium sediminis]PAB59959.1 hypothetical protein CCE28_08375 [Anaeromicrobium sediminis]
MDKYIEDLDYDMEKDDAMAQSIHPMMPPMGSFPSMKPRMNMDSSAMEMSYIPPRPPMGRPYMEEESHIPEAPYMPERSHMPQGSYMPEGSHMSQAPYMSYMDQMPMMPSMEHMDIDEMRYMEHMNEYMTAMYHAEACRMRALQCLKK